jgi:hypothetical protein
MIFHMNKDRMHEVRAFLIFRLTLTNSLIHLPGESSPKCLQHNKKI